MLPLIGISAGDPAGIGLEIILKALPQVSRRARWLLFTQRAAFERNARRYPVSQERWIREPGEAQEPDILHLLEEAASLPDVPWAELNRTAGSVALACLNAAGKAALAGALHGIVTAPVNKLAIGEHFHGQTDYLAEQAGISRFAMAFFSPTFKVVLATIHVSLVEALASISTPKYSDLIRFIDGELKRYGYARRRIAVAAINPHAGEGGMFGSEDDVILRPAVMECAAEGIDVSGPHSADSLYYRAHSGEFDIVIAPYHDQGLVPIKLIAHGAATNVTLGLPYVRTSPDHGTAFDIAGRDLADPSGMIAAMNCAVDLIERRRGAEPQPRQVLQRP